jgi:hypothetical protein
LGCKLGPDALTLVRRSYETASPDEYSQLLDKINILKNIENPNILKVEAVLEEETTIYVLYEYVANGLANILNATSPITLQKVK